MKKWLTVQDVQDALGRGRSWVTARMLILFDENPNEVKRVDHAGGKGYQWFVSRRGLQLLQEPKRDSTKILVDNLFREYRAMKAEIGLLKIQIEKMSKPKGLAILFRKN